MNEIRDTASLESIVASLHRYRDSLRVALFAMTTARDKWQQYAQHIEDCDNCAHRVASCIHGSPLLADAMSANTLARKSVAEIEERAA